MCSVFIDEVEYVPKEPQPQSDLDNFPVGRIVKIIGDSQSNGGVGCYGIVRISRGENLAIDVPSDPGIRPRNPEIAGGFCWWVHPKDLELMP